MSEKREGLAETPAQRGTGNAPDGYKRLLSGVRCRCPKMWLDTEGYFWCCNQESQAKEPEANDGDATGYPRRVRVGEASADLPATSEHMDVTAGETALLPCPFCGSSNIHDLPKFDWVACQDCGAQIEDGDPSARELWNRRAERQSPAENEDVVERLKDANDYHDHHPLTGFRKPAEKVDQGMTLETIEQAFDEWRRTLTVVDRPSNQEIFGQGYIAGWNAKESQPATPAAGLPSWDWMAGTIFKHLVTIDTPTAAEYMRQSEAAADAILAECFQPASGHCWCGLHLSLKHQCDRCMQRGKFDLSQPEHDDLSAHLREQISALAKRNAYLRSQVERADADAKRDIEVKKALYDENVRLRAALKVAKEFADDEFSETADLPHKTRVSRVCDCIDSALQSLPFEEGK